MELTGEKRKKEETRGTDKEKEKNGKENKGKRRRGGV